MKSINIIGNVEAQIPGKKYPSLRFGFRRLISIPILYIALRFPIHHNELGSRYQQLGNKTPDWPIFFGPEYDGCVCGTFAMLRSVVQPGGEASPVRCTAGAIVRIPPRLRHFVVNAGAEPLKMIAI